MGSTSEGDTVPSDRVQDPSVLCEVHPVLVEEPEPSRQYSIVKMYGFDWGPGWGS